MPSTRTGATYRGVCQSPLESSRQSAEQNTTATSHTGPSGSSMEDPAVVSHPTGDAGRLPNLWVWSPAEEPF